MPDPPGAVLHTAAAPGHQPPKEHRVHAAAQTATDPTYQNALDAVHVHCDNCTNCYQARRDGTWPTTACSTGKRLRKAAARAWPSR